jgi:hypothetical protein
VLKFKISLTPRSDKLRHPSKSVHPGENSQILTVSNKKYICSNKVLYHKGIVNGAEIYLSLF